MDLKISDSVMYAVFLHSKTGLTVAADAAVGLMDKILFTCNSIQCVPLKSWLNFTAYQCVIRTVFMKLVDSSYWGRKGFISTHAINASHQVKSVA